MKKTLRTMTAALGAAALAGMAPAQDANRIVVDGSTTVGPIAKAFAEYYMKANPGVNITVSESGSGNGAKSLINKTCDIGTLSRPMKEEELDVAKAKGLDVKEHVVAMDGIAVAVHPSNPVKALSKDDLRAIYAGEITNWKKLGGPDAKIVIISRDTNSGTFETFQTLVLKSDRVADRAEYVGSNGAVRQRVMSTPAAIGYVGLAFTDAVKVLPVNGVEPTPEKVLSKEYPIARPLYMYTRGEPAADTHVGKYLNLYKAADGRKIVEEQGFVPVP